RSSIAVNVSGCSSPSRSRNSATRASCSVVSVIGTSNASRRKPGPILAQGTNAEKWVPAFAGTRKDERLAVLGSCAFNARTCERRTAPHGHDDHREDPGEGERRRKAR